MSTEAKPQWTRITLSCSAYGEVSVSVPKTDLTLPEVLEDLLMPCLLAKGYSSVNVEKAIFGDDE